MDMLFLTDTSLSRVSGIVHGFGRRGLTEEALAVFCREWGLNPVWLDQIHSDIIHIIEDIPDSRLPGDGLITAVPGFLLVIKTADCLPLLLFDARLRVAAAVHAGWKGTRLRIVRKTVEAMKSVFGTNPADIIAAPGPCIGPACYEVGEDVRAEFLAAGFPGDLCVPAGRPGKYFFGLLEANTRELAAAGVRPSVPAPKVLCPHCDPNSFSWRRDRDPSRRMFSFIGILP